MAVPLGLSLNDQLPLLALVSFTPSHGLIYLNKKYETVKHTVPVIHIISKIYVADTIRNNFISYFELALNKPCY